MAIVNHGARQPLWNTSFPDSPRTPDYGAPHAAWVWRSIGGSAKDFVCSGAGNRSGRDLGRDRAADPDFNTRSPLVQQLAPQHDGADEGEPIRPPERAGCWILRRDWDHRDTRCPAADDSEHSRNRRTPLWVSDGPLPPLEVRHFSRRENNQQSPPAKNSIAFLIPVRFSVAPASPNGSTGISRLRISGIASRMPFARNFTSERIRDNNFSSTAPSRMPKG